MAMRSDLPIDLLLRLVVAVVCGAALGFHVGVQDRPGGLRPHILTTLGATLFCLTSQRLTPDSGQLLRTVQGIASGVGFIGASVVLRRGDSIQGVSTGASLWIAAAVGCSAGFGDWAIALCVAGFVALVNYLAYRVDRSVLAKLRKAHRRSAP
jgi:putative Mg2+ transporter-C (MgtC) family protein